MNWLNTDFVKCDKTENKSLVVTLEPHWRNSSFQEAYDATHLLNTFILIWKPYFMQIIYHLICRAMTIL